MASYVQVVQQGSPPEEARTYDMYTFIDSGIHVVKKCCQGSQAVRVRKLSGNAVELPSRKGAKAYIYLDDRRNDVVEKQCQGP